MGARTKSGIMLGLGEALAEVRECMRDLLNVGCRLLSIGQYCQPSKMHLEVQRYVHPTEFAELERVGLDMGFVSINAGPLVRSSYHADSQYRGRV